MNEDSSPKAPKPARKVTNGSSDVVRLEPAVARKLESQAQKLKMNKGTYASAAIDYFAVNGLDPTSQETQGFISVQGRMSEVGLEIRKQNVDIGNRLVSILRTWESNQYKFMQAQSGSLLGYLENIEANILNHQVALETQLLAPILDRLVRNGVETHMNRILTEILLLKFKDTKFLPEDLKLSTADYDGQLDRRIVSELRKLLEATSIAVPKATTKPPLVTPVVGAPAKPTGTSATPTTTSAAPKA